MKFCQSMIFTDPRDMVELAVAAESCGIDVIAVPDHLVVPDKLTSPYPYTPDGRRPWPDEAIWVDPWVAIAAMSAATSAMTFTSSVYIAALRDVFSVAKAVATASAVSGGRVCLGVGAGWSQEEYQLVGRDFASRGRRLDEMIAALRVLWTGTSATYEGTHISFANVTVSPASAGRIPIYCGGSSAAARHRATRLGDGWIEGVPLDVDGASELVARLRAELAEAGRGNDSFEIIVAYAGPRTPQCYRRLADAGVTAVFCPGLGTDPARPLSARIEQMERFAADVIQRM